MVKLYNLISCDTFTYPETTTFKKKSSVSVPAAMVAERCSRDHDRAWTLPHGQEDLHKGDPMKDFGEGGHLGSCREPSMPPGEGGRGRSARSRTGRRPSEGSRAAGGRWVRGAGLMRGEGQEPRHAESEALGAGKGQKQPSEGTQPWGRPHKTTF